MACGDLSSGDLVTQFVVQDLTTSRDEIPQQVTNSEQIILVFGETTDPADTEAVMGGATSSDADASPGKENQSCFQCTSALKSPQLCPATSSSQMLVCLTNH